MRSRSRSSLWTGQCPSAAMAGEKVKVYSRFITSFSIASVAWSNSPGGSSAHTAASAMRAAIKSRKSKISFTCSSGLYGRRVKPRKKLRTYSFTGSALRCFICSRNRLKSNGFSAGSCGRRSPLGTSGRSASRSARSSAAARCLPLSCGGAASLCGSPCADSASLGGTTSAPAARATFTSPASGAPSISAFADSWLEPALSGGSAMAVWRGVRGSRNRPKSTCLVLHHASDDQGGEGHGQRCDATAEPAGAIQV